MPTALFCVSDRHSGVGVGDEVDLCVDLSLAEGVDITGDIRAAVEAPWPPRIVEVDVLHRSGRSFARVVRDVQAVEVFGPRVEELHELLHRLDAAPWLRPKGSQRDVLERLKPELDAFVKGLRRAGPVPAPGVVFATSYASVRAGGRKVARIPAIAKAVSTDQESRVGGPRPVGACLAGLTVVSRLVRALAEPLFRGALTEFAVDPDGAAFIEFLGVRPPPIDERARIAHEALASLPTLVSSHVMEACIEAGTPGGYGFWLPLHAIAERLVDELRTAYPLDARTTEQAACASAAVQLAWHATASLLNEMAYAVSCHAANIVMRPAGAFDLWTPFVRMIEVGLPVFGLAIPGRLSFFDKRTS